MLQKNIPAELGVIIRLIIRELKPLRASRAEGLPVFPRLTILLHFLPELPSINFVTTERALIFGSHPLSVHTHDL